MNKQPSLVLFIDDDPVILNLLASSLKDHGFDIVTSQSGLDALHILETTTPHIILADLKMEPMNGFELFQEIKKIPRLRSIPFYFLTAIEDKLAKKFGSTLGVNGYFCKPVDIDVLVETFRKVLSH